MATLWFRIEPTDELLKFRNDTNKRLKEENLLTNPFKGFVEFIPPDSLICFIKPIYPNFSYLGSLYIFGIIAFNGFVWTNWFIPGIIVQALYVFWSNAFFSFALSKGLKKAGYKGILERL